MTYIRLIEILNSQELTIIKLAFNKEEVVYNTLFENTLRIADAYALGRSGAIIEVIEEDVDRAKIILSELGIEVDYDSEEDRFGFIHKIDKLTDSIPLIGKWQIGYRFLFLFTISLVVIGTSLLFYTIRISKSELTGHYWCVQEIIHNGKALQPNTKTGIIIIGFPQQCKEEILFGKRGMIALPGFDTYDIRGRWNFKTNDIIVISELEEFKEVYEGEYFVKTNLMGTMEFVSDKTTIKISRKY